jgi:VIT1/CCC1 family predicted Fe2+/Mn2+ transporter/rubrerythrin
MRKSPKLAEAILENWKTELIASQVYRALADAESSPRRRDLFLKMATSEEEHAALWAKRLEELGVTPDPALTERESVKRQRLIRIFGADAMIRRIEREERGAVSDYSGQITAFNDPETTAILERVIPDEANHAQRLKEMAAELKGGPRSRLESVLAKEKWHVGGTGSWIGDAIYGANDGLGAVFGIVSAVAGATGATASSVRIAGLAGMIGSAFSMGASAYLASKSEREVHEAEIERERLEIETDPQHEREELELMFQIKGFTEEESRFMAERLTGSTEEFLNTMVREELGLSEERLPNPWTSSFSASTSTAVGAFIPIIPFFFTSGLTAILVSLVLSMLAHFAVGASKTFVTGRSWLAQGWEMTFVGLLGGALAYGFGLLIGAHGTF